VRLGRHVSSPELRSLEREVGAVGAVRGRQRFEAYQNFMKGVG
jgi:hypothetical protein